MNTPTATRPDVDAFAHAVRAALFDLPQDEIDDLTDGLEADLTERADDAASDDDFGDPALYAEELRAAAGLPARSTAQRVRRSRWTRSELTRWATELGTNADRSMRTTAFGSGLLDAFIALRPVWWVLRGWAIYQLVVAVLGSSAFQVLPSSGPRWIAFLAVSTVSVQWGRGKWLPRRWLRVARSVMSSVAAVSLLVLIPLAIDNAQWGPSSTFDPVATAPQGLSNDGEPIGNIFAYDSDGEPITDVQLFDENGEPLDLVADTADRFLYQYGEDGLEYAVVPSDSVPGRAGWNVYPLQKADWDEVSYERVPEGAIDRGDVDRAAPPFAQVQPLADRGKEIGARSPSVEPSPSAAPSPSASPVP